MLAPSMESAPTERLIILVKAPRAGQVKTRLARVVGEERACQAYRQLVDMLLGNLAALDQVGLWFSPDDALEEVRGWARPGWTLHPQGEGDLGRRLTRAFEDEFSRGAKRLVAIGSDCPEVKPADVAEAFVALRDHDVVLGPARDGGYWLIGLRAAQPELFREIAWSTAQVLEQTLDRARSRSLSVRRLRTLADIDTLEDWVQGHWERTESGL